MHIRELQGLADVRGTDRVNRRCWQAAYDDVLPASVVDRDPASEDALRDRLAAIRSWTGATLVAVDDDRIVGYAFARWGDDTKPFVEADDAGLKELYVDPDHWNEGVGTGLLSRVEELVPSACGGLTLSMLAGNEVGRRFYDRRGFVEDGDTTDEIGGNVYACVLFRKPLPGGDR
ncbi:N-acetyltransferase family protein [Haloparvum sp. PAK95]|uniref:GNAT family N-acetyltransferase n=1 Tax=Haloparvum sp. PAK95 TaxID=3418962 RepID=UPI003D2F450D